MLLLLLLLLLRVHLERRCHLLARSLSQFGMHVVFSVVEVPEIECQGFFICKQLGKFRFNNKAIAGRR